MAMISPIEQYRLYLESVEDAAKTHPETEYLDLLSPGEALDLLTIRDQLVGQPLSFVEQQALERLDILLVKHYRLIADNVPHFVDQPLAHWWWHLHEGPQVRARARQKAGC